MNKKHKPCMTSFKMWIFNMTCKMHTVRALQRQLLGDWKWLSPITQTCAQKNAYTHSLLPAGLAWYWADSLLGCWIPGRLPAPGSDSITCTHASGKGGKKNKIEERDKVQWQKSNKEHMGGREKGKEKNQMWIINMEVNNSTVTCGAKCFQWDEKQIITINDDICTDWKIEVVMKDPQSIICKIWMGSTTSISPIVVAKLSLRTFKLQSTGQHGY